MALQYCVKRAHLLSIWCQRYPYYLENLMFKESWCTGSEKNKPRITTIRNPTLNSCKTLRSWLHHQDTSILTPQPFMVHLHPEQVCDVCFSGRFLRGTCGVSCRRWITVWGKEGPSPALYRKIQHSLQPGFMVLPASLLSSALLSFSHLASSLLAVFQKTKSSRATFPHILKEWHPAMWHVPPSLASRFICSRHGQVC